jgi:hypothetical protein
LQESGWVDVFRRAAEQGANEKVRLAGRQLLEEWRKEQAQRDKE